MMGFGSGCHVLVEESGIPAGLKGDWIGTAETQTYPELIYLNLDSIALAKLYYQEISLHSVRSFQVKGQEVRMEINELGYQGSFKGLWDGDRISGDMQTEQGTFPCHFIRIKPASMDRVHEFEGFFQLDSNRVVRVTPYMLDFNLVPIEVLDFHTGKKRIAFPIGEDAFVAGKRMLAPYPADFTVKFSSEGSPLEMTLTENGEQLTGKWLPQPKRYEPIEAVNKGLVIRGGITYPDTPGPYPLVVFVHGSGNQSRGNTFDDFVQLLPYYGVATLVYDKRGCGESDGTLDNATFADLASDLAAMIEAASKLPDVQKNKIGLLGIDQAGLIMPSVAAASNKIAFMVNLSGSALPMRESELQACANRMKADGFSDTEIADAQAYLEAYFGFVSGKQDSTGLAAQYGKGVKGGWTSYVTPYDNREYAEWWAKNLAFPIAENLAKLKIPVLAIYGEKDLVVPASVHVAAMKAALQHPESTVETWPGANHLLLLGEKRGDFQLSEIEGYPQGLFARINEWVLQQSGLIE